MTLSVESLLQQGFPRGIVDALKRDGVRQLLDHQIEAVHRFQLLGEEDLLVSLPTSCGKTLIGELAGVGAALLGRRAVFSVPLKALAREKYETFERRYGDYGLRICLATGEFAEHQHRLTSGDFDIAVMIHEKLLHTLLRDPGFLHGVRVAVLDELQGIEEPSRGPSLEFLLALLKTSQPRVRRVGLAGVLSPGDPLVEDFEGRVLTAHQRPIDLHEGIVLTDPDLAQTALAEMGLDPPENVAEETESFISVFRSHNTGMIETERLPAVRLNEAEAVPILDLALGLGASGETCLLFLPSRREAERAAHCLAEVCQVLSDSARKVEEEGIEDDPLRYCLERGVGFHHADCSPSHRLFVEEAFREGRAWILCCTSTLAAGVNLPAHNVLIHPFVWNRQGPTGELSLLSESVVRNMAGRAGRLGLEGNRGRALLLAGNRREWDLYRNRYWTALVPSLSPQLLSESLGPRILAGIEIGHDTLPGLVDLFRACLSGRSDPLVEDKIARALEDAANLDLLENAQTYGSPESRKLRLTPLGRVVALRGLSFETGHLFAEWVDRIEGRTPSLLAALLRVCATPEAAGLSWPRDTNLEVRAAWVDRVRERLSWDLLESFGDHWQGKEAVSRQYEDAAKMASALELWCLGDSLREIRDYCTGLGAGTLHATGESARWLLEALADVWQVRGGNESGAERLRIDAECAGAGLPEEALAWKIVPTELLDRENKLLFAREERNPAALLELSPSELARFPSPLLAERVRKFLEKTLRTARGSKREESNQGSQPGGNGILLDANLAEEGNLFRLRTTQSSVTMGIRAAELLLRLVAGRKQGDSEGWVQRDSLNIAPENLSQRISELRRRLGHPPVGKKSWIESDRSGHYRLACESHQIVWDPAKTPEELQALMR